MRFFTSDLHFGHARICDYEPNRPRALGIRAAATVAEMNEAIVRRWNEQVTDTDEVWMLGDVALGQITTSLTYVAQLNGRKFLMPGNHDRMHTATARTQRVAAEWTDTYLAAGFEAILPETVHDTIDGVHVVVCHFPYNSDTLDDARYVEHRPADRGLPLVHGHVHSLWTTSGRMFNVGVDAHDFRMVTEAQIGDHFRSIASPRPTRSA